MDRCGEAEVIYMWGGFLLFVVIVLAVDLGVFNRDDHQPSGREALSFTAVTVALALCFAVFAFQAYNHHWQGLGLSPDSIDGRTNDGHLAIVKFLTGYFVELGLSMDNVLVIALIFAHLRVPSKYQHRVLYWGILGAIGMRGAMIAGGTALVSRYHWMTYVFGGFLVLTSANMLLTKEKEELPEERWIVRRLSRRCRVAKEYHGQRFSIVRDGKRWITPLAVALVIIETTDLLFAVDSIPAIFAITTDPFLVFTSNVFAILCLRSLYFGLAGLIEKFQYLNVSLAVILGLVGAKMLAPSAVDRALGESQNIVTLAAVFAILLAGAGISAMAGRKAR